MLLSMVVVVWVEGEGEVHPAQPTHEGTQKAVVIGCNGGGLRTCGGMDVCVVRGSHVKAMHTRSSSPCSLTYLSTV